MYELSNVKSFEYNFMLVVWSCDGEHPAAPSPGFGWRHLPHWTSDIKGGTYRSEPHPSM